MLQSIARTTTLALTLVALPAAGFAQSAAASATPASDKGWISLFDGKSLDGWRGYKRDDASGTRWVVKDGLLCVAPGDSADTRGARDIITTNTWSEFELTWEWRVSPGGNSGVKYFVLEDRDAAIGHEYQIIDDEKHADAKISPTRQTASLYDVLAASNRPMKPAGEWNQSRILVDGKHVEHWLNGTKVLEYELGSETLRAAIAKSKFKDVSRFGTPQKGHILLQDHGDAVCYRNLKLRPINGQS
ncbi:MAG TPA: DUF1080 domain-containing protein [Vicinamibacterales bacterium]